MRNIFAGSTGHSEFFDLTDNISGQPLLALSPLQVFGSYSRPRSATVPFGLTSTPPTGVWIQGGFCPQSGSIAPGVFRCDIPDAAFAVGADQVVVTLWGTGIQAAPKEFRLQAAYNDQVVLPFPNNFSLLSISALGATSGINEFGGSTFNPLTTPVSVSGLQFPIPPTVGQISASIVASGVALSSQVSTAAQVDTQLISTHGAGLWTNPVQVSVSGLQFPTPPTQYQIAGAIIGSGISTFNSTINRVSVSGLTFPITTTPTNFSSMLISAQGAVSGLNEYGSSNPPTQYQIAGAIIGSGVALSSQVPTVAQIDTQLISTHGAGTWTNPIQVSVSGLQFPIPPTQYQIAGAIIGSGISTFNAAISPVSVSGLQFPIAPTVAQIDSQLIGTHGAGLWTNPVQVSVSGLTFPTITTPPNFSALSISALGAVSGLNEYGSSNPPSQYQIAGAIIGSGVALQSLLTTVNNNVLLISSPSGASAGQIAATIIASGVALSSQVSTAAQVDTQLISSHGAGLWTNPVQVSVSGLQFPIAPTQYQIAGSIIQSGVSLFNPLIQPVSVSGLQFPIAPTVAQIDTQLIGTHGAGLWTNPVQVSVSGLTFPVTTTPPNFSSLSISALGAVSGLNEYGSSNPPSQYQIAGAIIGSGVALQSLLNTVNSNVLLISSPSGASAGQIAATIIASGVALSSQVATAAQVDTQLISSHGAGLWTNPVQVSVSGLQFPVGPTQYQIAGSVLQSGVSTFNPAISAVSVSGLQFPIAPTVGQISASIISSGVSLTSQVPTVAQIDTQLIGTHGAGLWTNPSQVSVSGLQFPVVPTQYQIAGAVLQSGVSTFNSQLNPVSVTGLTFPALSDVYYADIQFTQNSGTALDEYTAAWFKNGLPATGNINTGTLHVIKRSNGTDLIAPVSMTVLASGVFKYDSATLMGNGNVGYAITTAVVDSSVRIWQRMIGRDL